MSSANTLQALYPGAMADINGRIEALTHSVERLAQMHMDNEKRFERIGETLDVLKAIVLNDEHRLDDLEGTN